MAGFQWATKEVRGCSGTALQGQSEAEVGLCVVLRTAVASVSLRAAVKVGS